MPKIVHVRWGGTPFAALERDDGTLVFGDPFAPPDGAGADIDGRRCRFVSKRELAAELEANGLPQIWTRRVC